MKKIVVIFLILASVFSFIIDYNQTDKEELKKISKVEEGIAKQFVIPNNLMIADANELYPLLYEAANEFNVNIFRTNINYNIDDKAEIVKYMLLIDDTDFFDVFMLKSGRFLSTKDTQQSDLYISTTNTGDKNQIGIIKDFGNNDLIMIKPLKTSYDHLPVYGQYFVEVYDDKIFNVFIEGFAHKVNEYYKTSFTSEDFKQNSSNVEYYPTSSISILKYINYMVFVITLILLNYYIFNESKRIGIIKMHGISNIRLWFIIVGRLIIVISILSTVVLLFLAILVKNTTYPFVCSTIVSQLKTFIIMIAISFIPYMYISKIKVSHIIKNRKDINGIFVLNILIKVFFSILLSFVCISIYSKYINICNTQENLKNWEHSKDYAIFYPVKVGYDQEDLENNLPIFTSSVDGELYPVLNKMGSILIDTRNYEEIALLLNKDYKGIESITVNNNYLQRFPVYDIHNNPVQISEDTNNWILMVPEKYHDSEKNILSFFEKDRASSIDYEKEFLHEEVSYNVKNQQIEIIWLANNQKIFSFNPEVSKSEHNIIMDPIIQVVTEKNSLITDKSSILGGGCTDPLKIKLINRDTSLTYKTLEPELKRLKLDDNLKHLITVNQFILQELYDLQKQINEFLLIGLGLISGLLILITQNMIIFFNKNQRKFIVRRLFGIGFFRTYKEYSLLFSMTWIFQLSICCIVNRSIDSKLLLFGGFIMLIELAVSVIALIIIEQRNKVKILKGGI